MIPPYAAASEGFVCRELGLIRVKGKLQPVIICELLNCSGESSDYGMAEDTRRFWVFPAMRALANPSMV
jgi:hypothetical protein